MNADIQKEIYLHIPNLSYDAFPSILEKDDFVWDANRLFVCLLYANEGCFTNGIRLIAAERPNDLYEVFICTRCTLWQLENWLNPLVYGTFVAAIEKLHASDYILMEPLMEAMKSFENGVHNWKDKKFSSVVDLIDAILPDPKFCNSKLTEHFNQGECVEMLIDWDMDVIFRMHQNQSALYYAVAHDNRRIILKLLQKGSFIGSAPNLFDSHVNCLDGTVIEENFDECITKCVDDDRFIEIELKNMISLPNSGDEQCVTFTNEMKTIELIGECDEQKHLLFHPVIAIFVLLKWNQMAFLFNFHFILYISFMANTIGYILCVMNKAADCMRIVFAVGIIAMMSYIIIRRIVHQIFYTYYRVLDFHSNVNSYWKCARTAITVILIALFFFVDSPTIRPTLATGCVISMACELFILAGSLFWSFSKYYVMFMEVAKISARSFQLGLILIPTFTFSFYLLLRRESLESFSESDLHGKKVSHLFSDFRSTMIKIVAMLEGEFENGDSNFDSTILSTILFIAFVFLITIVFLNMINGLAISNIQTVVANAELVAMRQRVKLMAQFERILSAERQYHRKYHNRLIEYLFNCFNKINTLEMLQRSANTKVFVGPDNRILVLRKDYKTFQQDSNEFEKNGSYLRSWISRLYISHQHLRVHPSIVREAHRIIQMKESKQKERYEDSHLGKRISKLENELDEIKHTMKQNNKLMKHNHEIITNHLNVILNKFDNIK